MTTADADATQDAKPSLISLMESIAGNAPEDGLTLHQLFEQLGDRAFGAMLFVLALPCCIPFLYGVPQLVSLPMAALALQMAIGRDEPWLPGKFADRRISKESLLNTAKGGRRFFGWAENFARPRLTFLTSHKIAPLIGAMMCVFCVSILTPLPSTNTVPGFAVAMTSFGMMERDGVLTLGGVVLGIVWICLLITAAMLGLEGISSLLGRD